MNTITPFDGYRPAQEQRREQLPVGGYACQIINAQAEARPDGTQMLAIMLEITEGTYAGFFHKDYASQQGTLYSPKYRGIYRIFCPSNNLRPEDSWIVDRFNLTLGAILASNPGYTWNWDAASLKGLNTGVSIRENEYRGNVYTEIGKLIPLSMVHDGSFRPMRRRVSRESGSNIVQGYVSPFSQPQPALQPAQTDFTSHSNLYSSPSGLMANNPPDASGVSVSPMPAAGLPQNYSDDADIPF